MGRRKHLTATVLGSAPARASSSSSPSDPHLLGRALLNRIGRPPQASPIAMQHAGRPASPQKERPASPQRERSPQRDRPASPQRERAPGQTRTSQLVTTIQQFQRIQKYALWDTRGKEDIRKLQDRSMLEVKREIECATMAARIREVLLAFAMDYRARAAAEKAQDAFYVSDVLSRTSKLAEVREADVVKKIKLEEEKKARLDVQLSGLRRAIDAQTGRTPALDEKRKALRELRSKNALRMECLERLDWAVALNEPVPRPLFASGTGNSVSSTSPPKGGTLQRQGSPSPGVLLATLRRAALQPPRQNSGLSLSPPPSGSPLVDPGPRSSSSPRELIAAAAAEAVALHKATMSADTLPRPDPSLTSSTSSMPPPPPSQAGSMIRSPYSQRLVPGERSISPRPVTPSASPRPSVQGSNGEETRLLYVQRGISSPGVSVRGINAQWQPDAEAPYCRSCRVRFTFTLRRHHCRLCGYIFCGDCSSRRVRIPSMLLGPGALKGEAQQEQRVCNKCYNAIMLQEPPP